MSPASPTPATPTRAVTDVNGTRYELSKRLGEGGQGAVYETKDGLYAVKIIRVHSECDREQAENTVARVKRLPITNLPIAQPFELLRKPHTGYVMKRITGMVPLKALCAPPQGQKSIAKWYQASGGLGRRLRLLAKIARMLAELHGMGLAYGDLSPNNVFVSKDVNCTEVWFIDADNIRDQSTAGQAVYTPGYAAPEILHKIGTTSLSDAYAFAILAFQVLTLTHPFIGDMVNNGPPELEEEAFAGSLPWIEDADDDSNRASFGIPRKLVLSSALWKLFARTFGEGRATPTKRPGTVKWAETLFVASDAALHCPACGGSSYRNSAKMCAWCGAAMPPCIRLYFGLWDDEKEDFRRRMKGNQKIIVPMAEVFASTLAPYTITQRLTVGPDCKALDDPVMTIEVNGSLICITPHIDSCHLYDLIEHDSKKIDLRKNKTRPVVYSDKKSVQIIFGNGNKLTRAALLTLVPGGNA